MLYKNTLNVILPMLLLWLTFTSGLSHANTYTVDDILALEEAPAGVVFEVVSADENYLQTALQDFENHRKKLVEQFPEIKLVIVAHGSEQFALTTANQQSQSAAHSLVQRLTGDEEVPVHVCGGHASWRGLSAEDFPDYVTVSKSGPGAIRDFQDQGYLLVML
ncbi:MAG: DsrE family protein [Thiolinea sp.]